MIKIKTKIVDIQLNENNAIPNEKETYQSATWSTNKKALDIDKILTRNIKRK
jgi:hypothetical protein